MVLRAVCAHAQQGPTQQCPLWVGRGLCRCQGAGAAVASVGPALPAKAPAGSGQWPRALLCRQIAGLVVCASAFPV